MFTKFLINIHRVLGIFLGVLCFMWFVSGIVMMYHGFPRVSQDMRFENQFSLYADLLPDVEFMIDNLPEWVSAEGIYLDNLNGDAKFYFGGRRNKYSVYCDSLAIDPVIDYDYCYNKAIKWGEGRKVSKVDSLYRLEQWIPSAHYKNEFPIYKFYFDGDDKVQIYVSSKSGDVIQYTTFEQRFWAWLGAIPHWIYFTFLKQNNGVWTQFMYWACYLGMVVCVTGMFLGIRSYWKGRKKGFLKSPYKKRWFKWHHVTGFVFGFFIFTFILSGYFSMAPLPEWLAGKDTSGRMVYSLDGNEFLPIDCYVLDYRKAIDSFDDVKRIEWSSYNNIPLYKVRTANGEFIIDASKEEVARFVISEEMIFASIKRILGDSINYIFSKMDGYDNYYVSKRNPLPLPVYKFVLDNASKDIYYYNLESLRPTKYSEIARKKRWFYRGLHTFDFKFLAERPSLRKTVLWFLMLGGAFVSFSGIVLTVKYLVRLFGRHKNRYNSLL